MLATDSGYRTTHSKKHFLSVFIIFIFFSMSHEAVAGLEKTIWPKWLVHNPRSEARIPHTEWQQFLNAHLSTNADGINVIDYPNFSEQDTQLLNRYINRLANIQITDYNRSEQLAYWINLYNALTVLTVARFYPVNSITEIDITPGVFSSGPWGAILVTVDRTPLSLDDIHHRIIRPIWNDPRTHYAINNATMGAANLNPHVYEGRIIEEQLNDAAVTYINSARGTSLVDGKLLASKLYNWFLDDFGGKPRLLLTHLQQFAHPTLQSQLKSVKGVNIYVYNWHLNTTTNAS